MKILLFGNPSMYHAYLAKGLREMGHEVTLISQDFGWRKFPGADIRLERRQDINSELALRITGNDAQGKRLELVFLRKLNECPTGDTYLPQRWAGQKILFLLSRLNSTDNPAEARSLNAQITDLTRRFKIYSAY